MTPSGTRRSPGPSRIGRYIGTLVVVATLPACVASNLVGDAIRSGQKDLEFVFAPGVGPGAIRSIDKIGLRINGASGSASQHVLAVGSGATNEAVFSDMIALEFMKSGYEAHAVLYDGGGEPSEQDRLVMADSGMGLVLVGNLNLAMTSSSTSLATGGDYANAGVSSFTVRGIRTNDGHTLFIISGRYGKSKSAHEVARDISASFASMSTG